MPTMLAINNRVIRLHAKLKGQDITVKDWQDELEWFATDMLVTVKKLPRNKERFISMLNSTANAVISVGELMARYKVLSYRETPKYLEAIRWARRWCIRQGGIR